MKTCHNEKQGSVIFVVVGVITFFEGEVQFEIFSNIIKI